MDDMSFGSKVLALIAAIVLSPILLVGLVVYGVVMIAIIAVAAVANFITCGCCRNNSIDGVSGASDPLTSIASKLGLSASEGAPFQSTAAKIQRAAEGDKLTREEKKALKSELKELSASVKTKLTKDELNTLNTEAKKIIKNAPTDKPSVAHRWARATNDTQQIEHHHRSSRVAMTR